MDEALAESQYLTEPEDIVRVLRSLLLNRSLLTLSLPGVRKIGASMVLAIDESARTWQVDALTDTSLQALLLPGKTLVIRAAYGGIQVSCETQFVGLDANAAGALLNLALPAKVLHRQRRAAFRADIATQDRPTITLESSLRSEPLIGQVFDISSEGMGVVFERFIRPPIESGEIFTCQQPHPDLPGMDWQLVAKHPQYDKQNDKYRCGFSFSGLTAATSKKLNQWVLAEQRKRRVIGRRDYNPL